MSRAHGAGHVARMAEARLARRTTEWRDSQWNVEEQKLPSSLRLRRPRRGRWFRWEDEIRNFAAATGTDHWKVQARRRGPSGAAEEWAAQSDAFAVARCRVG